MDPREELRQVLAQMEELDTPDMTDEQREQYEALEARAGELTTLIEAEGAAEARRSARERFGSVAFRMPAPRAGQAATGDEGDEGEFRSLGEFLTCVRDASFGRRLDPRLEGRENVMGTDEAGGFLVPTVYGDTMLEIPTSGIVVRPRATVIPAGEHPDAEMKFPALDQTADTGGMYGGVEVDWQDEESEDDVAEAAAAFKEVSVQAQGVSAFITVSNTLLRNASAAAPLLSRLLGNAVLNSEDHKFLAGDGSGTPLGATDEDNTGALAVNREVADSVCYEDVLAMVEALHPECVGRAVFVASQSLLAILSDIKDSSSARIYHDGDPSKGIAPTLLGIPVLYTGKVPVKGDRADLSLVDFTYYLVKDGAGLAISMSEHVLFKKNRTIIKVFRSVDGKPWVTAPMVLEDGQTEVSPYVCLDVPAS